MTIETVYVPHWTGAVLGSAHEHPWIASSGEAKFDLGQPVFLDRRHAALALWRMHTSMPHLTSSVAKVDCRTYQSLGRRRVVLDPEGLLLPERQHVLGPDGMPIPGALAACWAAAQGQVRRLNHPGRPPGEDFRLAAAQGWDVAVRNAAYSLHDTVAAAVPEVARLLGPDPARELTASVDDDPKGLAAMARGTVKQAWVQGGHCGWIRGLVDTARDVHTTVARRKPQLLEATDRALSAANKKLVTAWQQAATQAVAPKRPPMAGASRSRVAGHTPPPVDNHTPATSRGRGR